MTTLILTNNHGAKVYYKTDLLKGNSGRFTVMEILEMSDEEKGKGFDFKCIESELQSFIEFAFNNNLKLERSDSDGVVTTWDYRDGSGSESIFI